MWLNGLDYNNDHLQSQVKEGTWRTNILIEIYPRTVPADHCMLLDTWHCCKSSMTGIHYLKWFWTTDKKFCLWVPFTTVQASYIVIVFLYSGHPSLIDYFQWVRHFGWLHGYWTSDHLDTAELYRDNRAPINRYFFPDLWICQYNGSHLLSVN